MDFLISCLKAFFVGGVFCVIGQLLIDKTRLTPARILTSYVVAGVILGAVGVYQPLADWAGAGACVPLTGFGNTLARGGCRGGRARGLHRGPDRLRRRHRRRHLLRLPRRIIVQI